MNAPAPRRLAVVPAYNEAATVEAVLERLTPLVDNLTIVDDGSTDATRVIVQTWLAANQHAHVRLLTFDHNRGMSAAYYLAFTDIARRVHDGELSENDLIFTVDADGQHDLDAFEELQRITVDEGLDALLVQRDLSTYPWIKRAGNFVMSTWATMWAGQRLLDVESGYRVFRAGALIDALQYYKGWKYSETVEVAVVLCRLGYKVRNDVLVPVPVFRSRTSYFDAAVDMTAMPLAFFRLRWRSRRARGTAADPTQHAGR